MIYREQLNRVADFTEIDTLSSKDGVVICFHNVILNSTTDIAHHEEFADRKRTYEVQGVKTTGFYTGKKSNYFPSIPSVTILLRKLTCNTL